MILVDVKPQRRRLTLTAVIRLGTVAVCVQSSAPFCGIERELPGLRSWGLHLSAVEISRPDQGEEDAR